MAGETAHFNLRNREPTPAVRPFDVPPRLKAMLDGAHATLAEPFRGIAEGSDIVPGLFAPERTGVSLASLLDAARSFLATLTPGQRKAACFAIDDDAWRSWSNIHPWLMRHGVCLADLDGRSPQAHECGEPGGRLSLQVELLLHRRGRWSWVRLPVGHRLSGAVDS